jgi:predicted nucleotidyltransferase
MAQTSSVKKSYVEWLRQAASKASTAVFHQKMNYAWGVARRAADILRTKYGATRVRAFGSILHPERFHAGSDVDLAVEGVSVADYWDAVTEVFLLDEAKRLTSSIRAAALRLCGASSREKEWIFEF